MSSAEALTRKAGPPAWADGVVKYATSVPSSVEKPVIVDGMSGVYGVLFT